MHAAFFPTNIYFYNTLNYYSAASGIGPFSNQIRPKMLYLVTHSVHRKGETIKALSTKWIVRVNWESCLPFSVILLSTSTQQYVTPKPTLEASAAVLSKFNSELFCSLKYYIFFNKKKSSVHISDKYNNDIPRFDPVKLCWKLK